MNGFGAKVSGLALRGDMNHMALLDTAQHCVKGGNDDVKAVTIEEVISDGLISARKACVGYWQYKLRMAQSQIYTSHLAGGCIPQITSWSCSGCLEYRS